MNADSSEDLEACWDAADNGSLVLGKVIRDCWDYGCSNFMDKRKINIAAVTF